MNVLIGILFCVFALWRLYVYLKAKPRALSKEALSKSLLTLGFLGVLLIAVIALAVTLLNK